MEGEEVLKSGRGGKEWWEAGGGAGKNYLRWEEGVRSDVLCLPRALIRKFAHLRLRTL